MSATFSSVGAHGPPQTSRRWTGSAGATSGTHAEILELLLTVLGGWRRQLHTVVAAHDLNPMQFFALRALSEPLPMGQLAELLHCDRSHVTGVADELERRGVVERQAHPHDRRVKLLVLTEPGERLRDRVEAEVLAHLSVSMGIDEHQQQQLRDLLAAVAASQEERAEAPAAASVPADQLG